MVNIVLAAFLLLSSGQDVGLAAAAKSGDANPSADRVRCKYLADTGSRLKRSRICMTVREWDEQQRTNARELDRGATIIGGNKDSE